MNTNNPWVALALSSKAGNDADKMMAEAELDPNPPKTDAELSLSIDVPISLANENHDELGRFTSGEGVSGGSESHKAMKEYEGSKSPMDDPSFAKWAKDKDSNRPAASDADRQAKGLPPVKMTVEARIQAKHEAAVAKAKADRTEAQPVNHKAEADAAAKRGDRAAMRTHEIARVAEHATALPKNPRKLTIDQTASVLEAKGFRLGKGLGINRDSGKMEYTVTRPDGTRVALDTDAIKQMLYDQDKPKKAEAPASKPSAASDDARDRLNFQINGGRPYMSDRSGPGWVAGK